MKNLIEALYYAILLLISDIKIAGLYVYLYSIEFVLFIFMLIECLTIRAVCMICGIEPRMPISFKLFIMWIKYIGKFIGRDADEPDEDLDGRTYNEWADDAEEYIKNMFTRW